MNQFLASINQIEIYKKHLTIFYISIPKAVVYCTYMFISSYIITCIVSNVDLICHHSYNHTIKNIFMDVTICLSFRSYIFYLAYIFKLSHSNNFKLNIPCSARVYHLEIDQTSFDMFSVSLAWNFNEICCCSVLVKLVILSDFANFT